MYCSDQSTCQLLLAVLKQKPVEALKTETNFRSKPGVSCPFKKHQRNYKLTKKKCF